MYAIVGVHGAGIGIEQLIENRFRMLSIHFRIGKVHQKNDSFGGEVRCNTKLHRCPARVGTTAVERMTTPAAHLGTRYCGWSKGSIRIGYINVSLCILVPVRVLIACLSQLHGCTVSQHTIGKRASRRHGHQRNTDGHYG